MSLENKLRKRFVLGWALGFLTGAIVGASLIVNL